MSKNTIKEEEKILFKHYLVCTKCHFKFQIEHPESNNTKIGLDKMSCPICRKHIQLDPSMLNVSGKVSTESQSKMNIEASREALRMADEMKRADRDAGIGKMVPVTSYQEGKNKGRTEMLPESTIKSIEEKVAPEIKEINQ